MITFLKISIDRQLNLICYKPMIWFHQGNFLKFFLILQIVTFFNKASEKFNLQFNKIFSRLVKFLIMITVTFRDSNFLQWLGDRKTLKLRFSKTAFKRTLKAFLGINLLLSCDIVFCFILSSRRIKNLQNHT